MPLLTARATTFDATSVGLPVGQGMSDDETLDDVLAPFPRAGQTWADVMGAGDPGEYDYADVDGEVDVGASQRSPGPPRHGASATTPSIPVCTHDGFVLSVYLSAVERESVRALEEHGAPTAAAAARVGRLLWRYTDELTGMDRYLSCMLKTRPAEQQQQKRQATTGPLTASTDALIAQRFHVLARRAVHMFCVDARLLACRPSTQALSTPTAPDGPARLGGSSYIDTVPPSVS